MRSVITLKIERKKPPFTFAISRSLPIKDYIIFPQMIAECVRVVLSAYDPLINIPPDQCGKIGTEIPIPRIPDKYIFDLCEKAIGILKTKSSLLELSAPIYVVGDLHGNLQDLLRIFIYSKTPPLTRFLFLGDYVDRGQFSVEITTLLFALLCAYPEHIFLLRGNHEFEHVNQNYGFQAEVQEHHGSLDLYHAINQAFNYLPYTAVINKQIFCVHGGISPQISSLKQLSRFNKPLPQYEKDDIICDLVWSDPSMDTPDFLRSNRGSGVTFGTKSIQDFFKLTKMRHIIRAHQCVSLGIERFDGDNVYTVFSCSNYVDSNGNKCGLIFITPNGDIQSFSLPVVSLLERENTKFIEISESDVRPESLAMNLQLRDITDSNFKRSGLGLMMNQAQRKVNRIRAMSHDCLPPRNKFKTEKLPRLQHF